MTDAFTPAARTVVVATKSASRYFDLDAVRTPGSRDAGHVPEQPDGATQPGNTNPFRGGVMESNPAGAPPLDYWVVADEPPTYPEDTTMGTARYIVGDVFDVLATLEADSVDLIFSSPPFLALRSYLPADHPDKAKELGSEATPADFLDTLLDVVEACDRVLAPHGSLCFELGDTYAGGGSSDPRIEADGSTRSGANRIVLADGRTIQGNGASNGKERKGKGWPEQKSLCLIPTLFAASLAYGHNMLRPERSTPRWRVRNQIVWARPNPPVGALGDKYRPATSYVTVATKSPSRYFDLDAVRTPFVGDGSSWGTPDAENARHTNSRKHLEAQSGARRLATTMNTHDGAPPLDYWVIPTHPYPGAHYATFPPDLVVKPVKSMCPQRVCRVCGEPSRRIVEAHYVGGIGAGTNAGRPVDPADFDRVRGKYEGDARFADKASTPLTRVTETLGWTDCGHDDWRPGCVLDPFAGSGTTLAVATGHGRDAIGIDLDERNAELALDRVGPMFLTVEHLSDEGAA